MSIVSITTNPNVAEAEFHEKMKERMRAAMGDLMPDSVLQGIVSRGIDEAFFKPRVVQNPRGTWDSSNITIPPWTVEFIEKELKNQVAVQVEKWIAANEVLMANLVKDAIGKSLSEAVLSAFSRFMQPAFDTLRDQMSNSLQKLAQQRY